MNDDDDTTSPGAAGPDSSRLQRFQTQGRPYDERPAEATLPVFDLYHGIIYASRYKNDPPIPNDRYFIVRSNEVHRTSDFVIELRNALDPLRERVKALEAERAALQAQVRRLESDKETLHSTLAYYKCEAAKVPEAQARVAEMERLVRQLSALAPDPQDGPFKAPVRQLSALTPDPQDGPSDPLDAPGMPSKSELLAAVCVLLSAIRLQRAKGGVVDEGVVYAYVYAAKLIGEKTAGEGDEP
jgi:hypothetical protein